MPHEVVYPESALAWELRRHWAAREDVVLRLSERAGSLRVRGYVVYVSPTSAFCLIQDRPHGSALHVPVIDVLTVLRPHFSAGDAPAPEWLAPVRVEQHPGQLSFDA